LAGTSSTRKLSSALATLAASTALVHGRSLGRLAKVTARKRSEVSNRVIALVSFTWRRRSASLASSRLSLLS